MKADLIELVLSGTDPLTGVPVLTRTNSVCLRGQVSYKQISIFKERNRRNCLSLYESFGHHFKKLHWFVCLCYRQTSTNIKAAFFCRLIFTCPYITSFRDSVGSSSYIRMTFDFSWLTLNITGIDLHLINDVYCFNVHWTEAIGLINNNNTSRIWIFIVLFGDDKTDQWIKLQLVVESFRVSEFLKFHVTFSVCCPLIKTYVNKSCYPTRTKYSNVR